MYCDIVSHFNDLSSREDIAKDHPLVSVVNPVKLISRDHMQAAVEAGSIIVRQSGSKYMEHDSAFSMKASERSHHGITHQQLLITYNF